MRGEIWWTDIPDPVGSEPGYKRPVLILQCDYFTSSAINTIVGVSVTGNLRLKSGPGNILISSAESGLPKDSVVNVSQIVTIDKRHLSSKARKIKDTTLAQVEDGVRMILQL